jgi:hypothetical protein
MTDNGPNGQRFNAGLRATKGSVYEGGVRVPFFLRWPAQLRGGRRLDTMAAHVDVYPTILDLCGVERPSGKPIDGLSLRPLLEGRSATWPERMLFTHRGAVLEASVQRPTSMTPVPNRNLVPGAHYIDLPWERLEMGRATLRQGRTRLVVKARSKPGAAVMDLKSAALRLL